MFGGTCQPLFPIIHVILVNSDSRVYCLVAELNIIDHAVGNETDESTFQGFDVREVGRSRCECKDLMEQGFLIGEVNPGKYVAEVRVGKHKKLKGLSRLCGITGL